MKPRNRSESPAHKELKRLALVWAQMCGFRIAAMEVSLPDRSARIDVAAYRPGRIRKDADLRGEGATRARSVAAIGTTAIFECKAFKGDFRKDAKSLEATLESLETLTKKRERIEKEMGILYPSIRNGDSLFAEFETLNFELPGYERYVEVMEELRKCSAHYHSHTKFARLTKYASANLYYVVAEPGTFRSHELPVGWGALQRKGDGLELISRPIWHEVSDEQRLHFLHRIALTTTRIAASVVKTPPPESQVLPPA